jgi:two-component sensor histidine kinase
MGAMIRSFDWSATPLGLPATWPVPLRTALRLLLTTNHPIFLFWGPDHICFYNDAYKQSLGPEKHPGMLGARGREAWDEIWPIIGPQVEQVMAGGGATWHENHLVPITRFGRREEVYWTYSYGPIDDESAETGVGGVLVICTETTAQVRARRAAQEEAHRERRLFEAAPGFIAVLNGPDHIFEFVNAAYARLFGGREFVGKSVREVFPDVEGQGIFELLDQVYTTGKRFNAEGMELRLQHGPEATSTNLVLDFIYEPIIDEFGVGGIFVEGYDVTGRARAEEQRELLINELNHRVKNTLATVQSIAAQTLRNAASPKQAREALEARLIALSRAHDVLTRENWEGANVREIVTQAVEPYSNQRENRLHLRGPEVRLSPRVALALAMVLQELATNAGWRHSSTEPLSRW